MIPFSRIHSHSVLEANAAGQGVPVKESGGRRPEGAGGGGATLDDRLLRRIEREHGEGMSASQIVDAFTSHGVRLSEATFRKWVQLGLLPRSRRVGRKGKHQGSRGLYPSATLRRINQIKRLMAENLTIEEIGQSLQFRDEIESIERGLEELVNRFRGALDAGSLEKAERQALERLIAEAEKDFGALVTALATVERRIVAPLERAAKQRAFGAGSTGGAGELL